MAVQLEVTQFYEAVPNTSPATFVLTYTLVWDHTETWNNEVRVLVWGPVGVFTDTFVPSLANVTLTQGGATVTRSVTVAQSGTYTPLVQDGTFQETTTSPWAVVNGTISAGSVTLNNTGTLTQAITLQPGTYTINVTADAAITLTLNGLTYVNDTAVTVDETPLTLQITAAASLVHVTAVALTAVSITFPPVVPVLTNQTPLAIPPASLFPCYVVACDNNFVVQTAVYLTHVASTVGSPQSKVGPITITALDHTLTPLPAPALQPSSGLNN